MRRFLILALGLGACGGGVAPDNTVLLDEGTPCVADDGSIQLDFDTCLSSSCDSLVSATCEATLEGDVLVVTGEAEIAHTGDETCTTDCGFVVATCTGDVAAEGATASVGGVETTLAACMM